MRIRRALACVWLLALATTAGVAADSGQPTLRLTFVLDPAYDADNVVSMFRGVDPAGIEGRARSMGIDPATARRIRDAADPDARKLAREIVDSVSGRHGQEIEAARNDAQLQWARLLRPFSNAVVTAMQRPWHHAEYLCVISSVHPGLSNWYGSKVAVGYMLRSGVRRRILAHEIVLSQAYQTMHRAHGGAHRELDEWQIWAFSEITAVFILDQPVLNGFWPTWPRAGRYFGGSNYPQLVEYEKQLKKIYDDRASFDDYMMKAVPILRGFRQKRR